MKEKARLIIELDKEQLFKVLGPGMPGSRIYLLKVNGDGSDGERALIDMIWNYQERRKDG